MDQKLCLDHNISIKLARPEDIFELYRLVDLYDDDIKIDVNNTKRNLRDMLYNGGVFLATKDGETISGIAAYYMDGLFNNDKMFCVMFLFVRKEFRHLTKIIIKQLEMILMETKVTKILYGFLSGKNQSRQLRFMRILGYQESEVHVYKNIRSQGA